jgi:hypothetical protein
MEEGTMVRKGYFDDLLALATKFVEQQSGAWDHNAWLDLMSDVQKKGFSVTHDFQLQMGVMLENMKKFYSTTTATGSMESVMKEITDTAIRFVKKNNGMWDHSAWEAFLKDVQKKGVTLSDESMTYLGGMLEAAKELYVLPAVKDDKK